MPMPRKASLGEAAEEDSVAAKRPANKATPASASASAGAVAGTPAPSVPPTSSDPAPAVPSAPSAPTSSGAAPDSLKGSTMDSVQAHYDRIKAERAAKVSTRNDEAKAYLLLIFDGEISPEEVPDEIKSILAQKGSLAQSGNPLSGLVPHALPVGNTSVLQALAVQLFNDGKSDSDVAVALKNHASRPDKDTVQAAFAAAKQEVGR